MIALGWIIIVPVRFSAAHGTLFSRILLCAAALSAAFCATAFPAAAQVQTGTDRSQRAALTAVRADGPINVDGRLDEDAWHRANAAEDFLQFVPREGAPASQRTEARVLFGEELLYVGARLQDDDPSSIEAALGRRDDVNRADWFFVSLDSYFDRKTAYTFGVNAAGVQYDAVRTGGDQGGGGEGDDRGLPGADPSWDAIWYSDVRLTSDGWTAELAIPYSMLRFADAASQTWGIHFLRHIPRLAEESEWPLVPRSQRGNLIARFGLLEEIRDVDPKRNLQIAPYTVTQLRMSENEDVPGERVHRSSVDAGGDLKVGLGPNITLDVTVNPDFGQVESDPAVLNLTAFETFFDERRPFFVEGIQIYQFAVGPGELLYTRRIGARSPIVGAAKLSGRTAEGLSFGVLGATTGDKFDPTRHYGVSRVSRQIGSYSSAGGILTAFDGAVAEIGTRRRSFAGGADWDLRFLNNRFGVEGFAAFTNRQDRGDAVGVTGTAGETGLAAKTWLRKRQGSWKGFVGLDVFGDRFNPNELGQLAESNFIALLSRVEHDVLGGRAFGPFQRAGLESFIIQRLSYDTRLNLGLNANLGSLWTLRSFQEIELSAEIQRPFGGYDLYETRGLGPWGAPAVAEIGVEFRTDARRDWQLEPEVGLGFDDEGGHGFSVGLRGVWNLGSRISLSGDFDAEWEGDVVAWSSNETFRRIGDGWQIGRFSRPPGELNPEDYVALDAGADLEAVLDVVEPVAADLYFVPLFGARDTRSVDVTLRSTITFLRNLSLQFYGQLFLARGRYSDFRILQNRDDFAPFDAFPKRNDFALNSAQSNVVFRWEYRPGSTLFVVWTHGRRGEETLSPLGPWEPSPYDRALGETLAETFDIFPDNTFLVKLNYTFLY